MWAAARSLSLDSNHLTSFASYLYLFLIRRSVPLSSPFATFYISILHFRFSPVPALQQSAVKHYEYEHQRARYLSVNALRFGISATCRGRCGDVCIYMYGAVIEGPVGVEE